MRTLNGETKNATSSVTSPECEFLNLARRHNDTKNWTTSFVPSCLCASMLSLVADMPFRDSSLSDNVRTARFVHSAFPLIDYE